MKCNHTLRLLSPPEVDVSVSLLSSNGYSFPPIFQCDKCNKVFKTGWNENSLVEILIDELSDDEKRERLKNKNNKQTIKSFNIWYAIITIIGAMLLLLFILILYKGV